jgi:uncharacterized membrane protein YvlD (DUF360 family)
MRRLWKTGLRLAAVWTVEAISLVAIALPAPGVRLIASGPIGALDVTLAVALVLGVLNVLIRPLLLLLALPVNLLTLGFFTLVINGLVLGLGSFLLPRFEIDDAGSVAWGALVLAAVNTALLRFINVEKEDSLFVGLVERLSQGRQLDGPFESGRGLVMLEIDGLSHARLLRAARQGYMPTVRDMLQSGSHAASQFDCGLPSMTSSCQAGILYGDNYDIPAFRWFEKDRGKMMVSNNFGDAAEMDARYARGRGLLRGGSSISNLMSGDAARTMLTMSALGELGAGRRRQEDLYLFILNPYFFTRSVVSSLWDICVELFQGLRQRLRDIRPRVNRLRRGYPFLRAISNVFLRDLATFMVSLDVIRGVPVIYTTYLGYDEVAHYAGPDTPDAMNTLRGIDAQIRRVRDLIAYRATRPYDLIVLSDHGQSFGATFSQRHGESLRQLIDRLTAPEARVEEATTTYAGARYTAALAAELQTVERAALAGRIGQAALKQTRRTLQRQADRDAAPAAMDAEVTVCVSGNLAHVYFNLRAGKIALVELNDAYPDLVARLVAHPGIGWVVAYTGEDHPVALGKDGARDLSTGVVTDRDPLQPYGSPDLRAAQLLRMAQFPHAGDLIINSALYADGQVASFEEMVGSHGGLGGEQTDAFMLHPVDMVVPPVSNSAEVFSLLDARRGLPAPLPAPVRAAPPEVSSWTFDTLWTGLLDWRTWGSRALRAFRLDKSVFGELARDPFSTGPALLILLVAVAVQGFVVLLNPLSVKPRPDQAWGNIAEVLLGWVLIVMAAHYAGRWLRGKGEFTDTFRAMSFALMPQLLGLLRLAPSAGPLFGFALSSMSLLAAWMALQEALGLQGRAALLIPLAAAAVAIISVAALSLTLGGIEISIASILWRLGIAPAP